MQEQSLSNCGKIKDTSYRVGSSSLARTYYAEGRQIANFLRGLFGLFGLVLYFYIILGLHWSFIFLFQLIVMLAAEIMDTNKRKSAKQ